HPCTLDRKAPGRDPLIRRQGRITLNDSDTVEWDIELLGGDLRYCGLDPGSEVDVAAVDRYLAVLADRDERLDISERHWLRNCGGAGRRRMKGALKRKRDDKHSACLQEAATIDCIFQHRWSPTTSCWRRVLLRGQRAGGFRSDRGWP